MNGLLIVNKPAGYTSMDICAIIRRLSGIKKVGHTGTLDPNATGVLPICLGRNATKLVEYMDATSKTYKAECLLGKTSDTQDIWGTILEEKEVLDISKEQIIDCLNKFLGETEQIPPMYSNIWVNGRRLLSYARAGEMPAEMPTRRIVISKIELLEYNQSRHKFSFEVTCSRGTYVRTICHDIGRLLGCGAVMSALVRTEACGYNLDETHSLEELNSANIESFLLPVNEGVRFLNKYTVSPEIGRLILNGNPVYHKGIKDAPMGRITVFCEDKLIAILNDKEIEKAFSDDNN